jgi:hypothetical protein
MANPADMETKTMKTTLSNRYSRYATPDTPQSREALERQAKIVERMYELAATGMPLGQLLDELNRGSVTEGHDHG